MTATTFCFLGVPNEPPGLAALAAQTAATLRRLGHAVRFRTQGGLIVGEVSVATFAPWECACQRFLPADTEACAECDTARPADVTEQMRKVWP